MTLDVVSIAAFLTWVSGTVARRIALAEGWNKAQPQPGRADLQRPRQGRDRSAARVGHAPEADLKYGLLVEQGQLGEFADGQAADSARIR
jgi:hypothetical protein